MTSFTVFSDPSNLGTLNKNEAVEVKRPVLRPISIQTDEAHVGPKWNTGPWRPTLPALNENPSKSTLSITNGNLKVANENVKTPYENYKPKNNHKLPVDSDQKGPRQPLAEVHNLLSKRVEAQKLDDDESSGSEISSPGNAARARELDDKIRFCELYRNQIYRYLRQYEAHNRPKAYYMKSQPDITHAMRIMLIDWIVDVGEEFKLHPETLYMSVSLVDRFLSKMAVVRSKLQLLGTAAMFIASKYEEIYPPEITDFTYITDNTYTKKQVLRMEQLLLKVLAFDLTCPTPYTFLNHLAVCCSIQDPIKYLAMYICELTLLDCDPYLEFNYSLIACSAIALARHCLGYAHPWTEELKTVSGYTLSQFAPILIHLNKTHAKAPLLNHTAVRDKYKADKYCNASDVTHHKLIVDICEDSS